MGIVKLSTAGILDYQKYSSVLAGNAAFTPSAFDLLETQVLTSSASSVTFTGLGSYTDYKHLQLRATNRSDRTFDNAGNIFVNLNGDTGANYAYHSLSANGTSVFSSAASSSTYIWFTDTDIGNASTTGSYNAMVWDILDPFETTKYTTIRCFNGLTSTGENAIGLQSGLWMNTNALNSISLDPTSNNFVSGSRFSLYGIKGA